MYSVTGYLYTRSSILKSKEVFLDESHQDVTREEHSMKAKKQDILFFFFLGHSYNQIILFSQNLPSIQGQKKFLKRQEQTALTVRDE